MILQSGPIKYFELPIAKAHIEVPEFRLPFTLSEHTTIRVDLIAKYEHTWSVYSIPVLCSQRVRIFSLDTGNETTIRGTNSGGNIANRAQHYLALPCSGTIHLSPGDYQARIYVRSSSSAVPATAKPAILRGDQTTLILTI